MPVGNCSKHIGRRGAAVAIMAGILAIAGAMAPAQAGGASWIVKGESVTIELVRMPKQFQDGPWILDLFAASADSSFWCGPIKPNPHSWLTLSVICRDTTDFQIEYATAAGDEIEMLEFRDVAPLFCRVDVRPAGHPAPDRGIIRFIHAGEIVHESRFAIP
jgi:hypothetical protein